MPVHHAMNFQGGEEFHALSNLTLDVDGQIHSPAA